MRVSLPPHPESKLYSCLTEVEKTYQTCKDFYYGISEKDVSWVLDKCAICKLSLRNEGRATIKPIVAKHCMDRLVIDLMDFRAQQDADSSGFYR
jgi:hypothetical protein